MDHEKTRASMDLATHSAKEQIELNKTSLTNQLDAADRILLRKAADVSLNIAELSAADPT